MESAIEATTAPSEPSQPALPGTLGAAKPSGESVTQGVDKSVLALSRPRRLRDKNHRIFVSKQPCLICGRQPADAHHIRFAQHRALARKVSDEFTVPLCRTHHREVHRFGDEAAWWAHAGVDAIGIARKLWMETHPLSLSAGRKTPGRDALLSPHNKKLTPDRTANLEAALCDPQPGRAGVKSRHQNLRSLPRLLLVRHVAVHNPVSAPRAGRVIPAGVMAAFLAVNPPELSGAELIGRLLQL